jgi:hypothetical protein
LDGGLFGGETATAALAEAREAKRAATRRACEAFNVSTSAVLLPVTLSLRYVITLYYVKLPAARQRCATWGREEEAETRPGRRIKELDTVIVAWHGRAGCGWSSLTTCNIWAVTVIR